MDLAARRLRGGAVNGFGPRAHGRHTGYLWSWTNIYTGGKYVADGKWDADTQDQQCGMVPMMAALLRLSAGRSLDPSLALADAPPWSTGAPPAPLPAPTVPALPPDSAALFDPTVTAWLQAALNRLNATEGFSKDPPLVVDGSYGRHTRPAGTAFQAAHGLVPDGLAWPLPIAEISEPYAGASTALGPAGCATLPP